MDGGVSGAKEAMAVTVSGVETLPKGLFAYWVQGGIAYDLRASARVSLAAHKSTEYGYIVVTGDKNDLALYTGRLELRKTFPNPFAGIANIEFLVPYGFAPNGAKIEGESRAVSLRVYDIAGRRVKDLTEGSLQVGFHRVAWNGTNDFGAGAASGFYVVRLEAKGASSVMKMIKVR